METFPKRNHKLKKPFWKLIRKKFQKIYIFFFPYVCMYVCVRVTEPKKHFKQWTCTSTSCFSVHISVNLPMSSIIEKFPLGLKRIISAVNKLSKTASRFVCLFVCLFVFKLFLLYFILFFAWFILRYSTSKKNLNQNSVAYISFRL